MQEEIQPDATQNKKPNAWQRLWTRFVKSNNRSLGTIFGCIAGCAVGTVLVINHAESFPLVGTPVSLAYQVLGVLLATGTGGNLSSYIGASIDIITGEKTLFDFFRWLGQCCQDKKKKAAVKEELMLQDPKHLSYPYMRSREKAEDEVVLPPHTYRETEDIEHGHSSTEANYLLEQILKQLQQITEKLSHSSEFSLEEFQQEKQQLEQIVKELRQQNGNLADKVMKLTKAIAKQNQALAHQEVIFQGHVSPEDLKETENVTTDTKEILFGKRYSL